jgi:hypothetical protein
MAATFNKFQDFMEVLGKGLHHLDTAGDTLKIFLSNEQPLVTDTVKTDIAECADIANETNHGAGGADIENDYTETTGTGTLTGVDKVFEASGGTVGPFQFVVLYNDTHASDALIGWWDYGSAITLQDGETFTVDFGASILTLGP